MIERKNGFRAAKQNHTIGIAPAFRPSKADSAALNVRTLPSSFRLHPFPAPFVAPVSTFGLVDVSTFPPPSFDLRSSRFDLSPAHSLPPVPPCMPRVIYRKEICAMTVRPAAAPSIRTKRPPNCGSEKKDAKRTQFSALALSKTRFASRRRTQTNPPRRTLRPVRPAPLELQNPSPYTILSPQCGLRAQRSGLRPRRPSASEGASPEVRQSPWRVAWRSGARYERSLPVPHGMGCAGVLRRLHHVRGVFVREVYYISRRAAVSGELFDHRLRVQTGIGAENSGRASGA